MSEKPTPKPEGEVEDWMIGSGAEDNPLEDWKPAAPEVPDDTKLAESDIDVEGLSEDLKKQLGDLTKKY
jgi:hypothetical protein